MNKTVQHSCIALLLSTPAGVLAGQPAPGKPAAQDARAQAQVEWQRKLFWHELAAPALQRVLPLRPGNRPAA